MRLRKNHRTPVGSAHMDDPEEQLSLTMTAALGRCLTESCNEMNEVVEATLALAFANDKVAWTCTRLHPRNGFDAK